MSDCFLTTIEMLLVNEDHPFEFIKQSSLKWNTHSGLHDVKDGIILVLDWPTSDNDGHLGRIMIVVVVDPPIPLVDVACKCHLGHLWQ